MSKNFHRDYADSIGHFCESIAPELNITSQEIDAYFRSCALCLWAGSEEFGGDVIGINQIYTDRQAKFTPEQFEKAIAYYRTNPEYTTGVPEFFSRLAAADVKNNTSSSRTFAEVQKNLLMLCAAYDGSFSFAESRRITRLNDLLIEECDRLGVPGISLTPGPEYYLNTSPVLRADAERRAMGKLNDIMDEFSKVMAGDKSRNMYQDFFGSTPSVMPSAVSGDATVTGSKTKQESPVTENTPVSGDVTSNDGSDAEVPKPTLEEAMAELNGLVGLDVVKKDVDSLVNLVKVRELRRARGLKYPDMSFHLVFSGNPGTGKTTVARIIGKIYSALGLLSKGHLIEVDRSGLVAGYVGQTAIKTQEVIQKALGGILFIDEAYSLAPEKSDKDFGQEAIDTILKAMEDHRDDFVVIVAGYASLMPRFIDSNPGLKSRFNKYLEFSDYDGEQLYEIFAGRVHRNDYKLNEAADTAIREILRELYEDRDENFGNGRDVRNLFEKIVSNQANRIAKIETPTDEDILTITEEDLSDIDLDL